LRKCRSYKVNNESYIRGGITEFQRGSAGEAGRKRRREEEKGETQGKRGRSIEISLVLLTVEEIEGENERSSTVSQVSGFSSSVFFRIGGGRRSKW